MREGPVERQTIGDEQGALTIAEVCTRLQITKGTAYQLIRTGALPAFRLGRSYRIEPQDLQRFKEARKAVVAAATREVADSSD